MTIDRIVGVNVNCQWPGFASTRLKAAGWGSRRAVLVAKIKTQKPSVITAQELGAVEAAELFRDLGGSWRYQRHGLNVCGWHLGTFDDGYETRQKSLDSFGQMARTALAVKIRTKDGNRLRLLSSHLAAAASDLSPADAIVARARQAQQFVSWANDDEDDWPTVVGMDANSRQSDNAPGAPRDRLRDYGWRIDAEAVKIGNLDGDAKRGIDLVAVNYGAVLDDVDVFTLGSGSDHDGRRFVLHTTKR